jgi:hypothetical protein
MSLHEPTDRSPDTQIVAPNFEVTSARNFSTGEFQESLEKVRCITQEIFSQPFSCYEREDCEIADDRHFAVEVVDDGELKEIAGRNDEWHRRIALEIPSNVRTLFRLSIDAR